MLNFFVTCNQARTIVKSLIIRPVLSTQFLLFLGTLKDRKKVTEQPIKKPVL